MNILWFTWKDKKNPLSGGAEVVNEELAKRLVGEGHKVTFLTGGFSGCRKDEIVDGYRIIRLGNRWTVYWKVWRYYRKNLIGWADLAIDEINTIPFFCKFYVRERNILFVHQLAREIWFYQMFFPLSIIGYLLEPIYLRILSDKKVITVSESTKKDLLRFGFKKENVQIISEGIEISPVNNLEREKKFEKPTLLSLGAIRPMKRTKEIFLAFESAKKKIPDLKFVVAGSAEGKYGKEFLSLLEKSKYSSDISFLGKVSPGEKIKLMKKSHLLAVASVKEGWGLVVTEANSQGTPAVAYDADGLRDSIKNGQTGLLCDLNTPENMAQKIVLFFNDPELYEKMRKKAYDSSLSVSFENSYSDFKKTLGGFLESGIKNF